MHTGGLQQKQNAREVDGRYLCTWNFVMRDQYLHVQLQFSYLLESLVIIIFFR